MHAFFLKDVGEQSLPMGRVFAQLCRFQTKAYVLFCAEDLAFQTLYLKNDIKSQGAETNGCCKTQGKWGVWTLRT